VEMRSVDTRIAEIRKEVEGIAGLRRGLQARVDEEIRLGRSLDELRVKILDMARNEEEYSRTYRLIEDGRRQDSKRLVDMQGEVAALRKRADEQRGQTELLNSNFRKVDARLAELTTVEVERRESQAAFLDKQALLQVEHDRSWKEWQARIDTIEAQSADVEQHLTQLDETHRSIKRLKEITDELLQRVERRVSEITEVQRLTEERFRQDWVTFKADDQKRWTNYTLTQDEQRGETVRNFEKLVEQVAQVEDNVQELKDAIEQMINMNENRLQSLLSLAHDWVAEHERTEGRAR